MVKIAHSSYLLFELQILNFLLFESLKQLLILHYIAFESNNKTYRKNNFSRIFRTFFKNFVIFPYGVSKLTNFVTVNSILDSISHLYCMHCSGSKKTYIPCSIFSITLTPNIKLFYHPYNHWITIPTLPIPTSSPVDFHLQFPTYLTNSLSVPI